MEPTIKRFAKWVIEKYQINIPEKVLEEMYNDSRREVVNAWEDGALAGESYMFWMQRS